MLSIFDLRQTAHTAFVDDVFTPSLLLNVLFDGGKRYLILVKLITLTNFTDQNY